MFKGWAGKGPGYGLAPVRSVDALIHVVRVFENESVPIPKKR